MKTKLPIIIISLLPFVLSSCGCSCSDKGNYRERQDEEETKPEDIPEEKKEKKVSELTEEEYKLFPSLYLEKLNSYTTYKSVTKGKTVATVWFIKTEQSIDAMAIKSEYSYYNNESHSSLVNTTHTAYYHGDKAVFKDGGDYQVKTLKEYLDVYGIYPLDQAIEGYTVGGNSIKSIEKLESEENFKFKLVFDPNESTNNVKIQMKKTGGLSDYPSFSDISMTITVKDDFTPVSIDLVSHYVASVGVDSNCEQTYTVTFSDFNGQIEVPGLTEEIKAKFNEI